MPLSSAALIAAAMSAGESPPGPIGTPINIGSLALTTGNSVVAITTSASAPVGSLIALFAVSTNSTAISSAVDSASNSYSTITPYAGGGSANIVGGLYSANVAALTSGGSATVTFAAPLGRKLVLAASVSGIAVSGAFAGVGAGATGATASPSVGYTPANANAILFAVTYLNSGAVDTWTEDAAWTALGSCEVDTRIMRVAYKIVSSVAPVTYAPTNSASRTWTTNIVEFKGAA